MQLQTCSSSRPLPECVGIQKRLVSYCKLDQCHSDTMVVEEVEWVALLAGAQEVEQHLFGIRGKF